MPPPPKNLTRTQFLKDVLVLIFSGSGELQKAVLVLECPKQVKLRFSFYAFHVVWLYLFLLLNFVKSNEQPNWSDLQVHT